MKEQTPTPQVTPSNNEGKSQYHLRFHLSYQHLASVFGDDWFATKAESFARFFGTPIFLMVQSVIVLIWICLNVSGFTKFDIYPFVLLNLAFSLQSAYAAPLILLAQTRQADRDKAHTEADAKHREAIAQVIAQREAEVAEQSAQMLVLLNQNTQLTELVKDLSQHIKDLTTEMHDKVVGSKSV
jgi:uncharacterized membrane protein